MAKQDPISVPWRVRDALVVFAAAWLGLPILLILSLNFLAGAVPSLAGFINGLGEGDITASFVFVALDAVAAMALVRLYLNKYNTGWATVGWRPFSILKTIIYIVAIYAVFIIGVAVAYALVSALFPGFNPDQAQVNEFTSPTTAMARRLSFLALVVIPPILEETVFRGFIFPAFARRWGPVLGAVATSILFGIAHWQLNIGVYTFVISLLLCMMYWKLRSIWPGIFFHMINNYLAYVALVQK